LGDTKVYVPFTSLVRSQKVHLEGVDVKVSLDPPVEEYVVDLLPASLDDPKADWERLDEELRRACGQSAAKIDLMALCSLPSILRECGWKTRVTFRDQEIINVRPSYQTPLGLTIDLGTSKIAAYLIDLETGKTTSAEAFMNPQQTYGGDVMSRVSYAIEGGGKELREVVIAKLNEVIRKLCPEPERIVEMTMVGNTVMHHLSLGLPVKQLGLAPYIPAVTSPLDLKARDIGLHIAPGAYVHLLPNVGGFIGGDHVAMILATSLYNANRTVLGLDIGTNTEIVLAHQGKIKCTACASGPAFEGGHIKHGMAAMSGAIEKVMLSGAAVEIKTINGAPPLGICGSGILDAVAELCRVGLINRKGALLKGRSVRHIGKTREFILVSGEKTGTSQDITVTQNDINEAQIAKAAIRVGIEILLEEMGTTWNEIEEVIIAGGFGTSVSPASAIAIGMFPPVKVEQCKLVGNAAGIGGKLCLISRSSRAKAQEIARQITYLELMTHSKFHAQFARAMYFEQG
jgi:uncharacterized 2Fe-2S/4Fe-4S cluster protein (DUF4445 family)